MHKIIGLKCKNCGASINNATFKCEYCSANFYLQEEDCSLNNDDLLQHIVTLLSENPNNVNLNYSTGLMFLKRKMFQRASLCFSNAILNNVNNVEAYYYYVISLLDGKKPFMCSREVINKCEKHLKVAISISNSAKYYFLYSYIKYDYFERKYLNTSPTYKELLEKAINLGISINEAKKIYDLIGIDGEYYLKLLNHLF